MEILAQKKQGKPWQYIVFVVMGVFCLVVTTIMFVAYLSLIGRRIVYVILPLLMMVALGIAFIVIGIISSARVKKTPDCITLNGNQVDLGNGLTVSLSQITRVDYREARARYYTYRWGTLTVYLENQKIDYYYYDDVQYARDRIMQMIWQAKNGN